MERPTYPPELLLELINRVNVGLMIIDRDFHVVLWNEFMENHSRKSAASMLGQSLFESFPELPEKWLRQKVDELVTIKNFIFTSWEQRPYLFQFQPHRPITGGVDFMRQNCTLLPLHDANDEITQICILIYDATDAYMYYNMLQGAMESLEDISNRDGLTGVFNRRFFDVALHDEYIRARRANSPLSLILLDLDHFKNINDTHGHLMGDEVLRAAARITGEGLRKQDVLARYGGEEFAIILPHTATAGALIVADRLRERIEHTQISLDSTQISVTASLGVAELTPEMQKYETLLLSADIALYTSKESGRNRVTPFHHNLISNYHNSARKDRG